MRSRFCHSIGDLKMKPCVRRGQTMQQPPVWLHQWLHQIWCNRVIRGQQLTDQCRRNQLMIRLALFA